MMLKRSWLIAQAIIIMDIALLTDCFCNKYFCSAMLQQTSNSAFTFNTILLVHNFYLIDTIKLCSFKQFLDLCNKLILTHNTILGKMVVKPKCNSFINI